MPRAAGSPTSSFELPVLSVAQLQPQPVSGYLLVQPRQFGDRYVAHWRDAAGQQTRSCSARRGRGADAGRRLTDQAGRAGAAGRDPRRGTQGRPADRAQLPRRDVLGSDAAASGCATSSSTAAAGRPPCAATAGWSTTSSIRYSATCRCARSAPSSWTPTAPTSSPRGASHRARSTSTCSCCTRSSSAPSATSA